MATVTQSLLTVEEFFERYDGVPWCELIRGKFVQLSPASHEHNRAVSNVHLLLGAWARNQKTGRTFTGEPGLITERSPDTVRGADVVYFSYERMPLGKEPSGYYTVAPELVVEVTGKGRGWDAMVEKAGEYLQMGVDRVWIVDPRGRTVHLFGPDAAPRQLNEQDEVRDEAILPGFSCHVADFFAD